MATYSELLQTPEWDEKRKEILQRDNYTCQECGIKDVILQVHHHYYHYGLLPWEYEDSVYITLCVPCHEREEYNKNFDQLSIHYLLNKGLTREDYQRLITVVSQQLGPLCPKDDFKLLINRIRNGER